MFDFHEKRKIRGVLYSWPVIVFLFVITVVLSFSAYNRYLVARDMEAKLNVKRAELDAMNMRANAIESRVRYLEDERGIEEELRSRFDAVREGEQVIIFLNNEDTGEERQATPSPQQGGHTEQSLFGKLKFW